MKIDCPEDIYAYLKKFKFNKRQEEFYVILLDVRRKVLRSRMVYRGTIDKCVIHPRDIFNYAVRYSASSIVVAHNHPSGDIEPSMQDIDVTKRIYECSKMMNIPLQDHVIFTDTKFVSLRKEGII